MPSIEPLVLLLHSICYLNKS